MKNIFVIEMILLFWVQAVISQSSLCPRLQMKDNVFDWYHQPKDDHFGSHTCAWSEGSDHFYLEYFQSIEDEGNMYFVYPTYIKFKEIEGALIEKVSKETGEKLWQQTFDLRNNDAQERVAFLNINKEHNLEVYSYRRLAEPSEFWIPFALTSAEIDSCIISKRVYNSTDGSMISFTYPDTSSNSLMKITHSEIGIRLFRYINDNTYAFLRRQRDKIYLDYINIYTGQVINSFQDTVEVDKPYFSPTVIQKAFKSLFASPDTIINVVYVKKANTTEFEDYQAKIIVYDGKLNRIKELDINSYLNVFYNATLVYADNRYMVLNIVRGDPALVETYREFLIFDYDGNLLHDVTLKLGDTYYAKEVFHPLPTFGEFLFAGMSNEIDALDFLILSSDGQLKRVAKLYMDESRLLWPKEILSFNDKELVLRFGIGDYEDGVVYVGCHNEIVKIQLDKALGTSTSEVVYQPILVYPNPTSGKISFKLEDKIGTVDIRLFDLYGHEVLRLFDTLIDDKTIDISNFSTGIYLFKISKNGKKLLDGKIVKVD